MNILSQDGTILVNYNNVASFYIQKKYMQYSHPDTWWEIVAIYLATSEGVPYNVLARFKDEKRCREAFAMMVSLIQENKADFITLSDL